MEQYSVLSQYYDKLNSEVDYDAWCGFITETLEQGGINKGAIILDLACGTGRFTNALAKLGYDMIGVDISSEMLSEARAQAEQSGVSPLYICQDMRLLDLYGTTDAAICCLDGFNYLKNGNELSATFARLAKFIRPGGLLIFDINTRHKFESVYGDNAYIFDEDDVFCAWQNNFNPKSGFCDFYLTFFSRESDGSYTRADEYQREKYFPDRTVKKLLAENGFHVEAVYPGFERGDLSDTDDRHYFIAKRI